MKGNRLFVQSKHSRLLLSLLSFEKKAKTSCKKDFLDAKLIRVAPECRGTCGLACVYGGTFSQKCVLLEVIKENMKQKDARGWNSLTDLHPTHGVAPCRRLVGIIMLRRKGHTLFPK
jgi:hypothetical protein